MGTEVTPSEGSICATGVTGDSIAYLSYDLRKRVMANIRMWFCFLFGFLFVRI
jgi:hypothetical protein